jgi:hypothetical protein
VEFDILKIEGAMNQKSYVPAELVGEHYHPIGGQFTSMNEATDALERHFNNRHGGGGTFRVYRSEGSGDAIVEAVPTDGDAMAMRAIYKVVERG